MHQPAFSSKPHCTRANRARVLWFADTQPGLEVATMGADYGVGMPRLSALRERVERFPANPRPHVVSRSAASRPASSPQRQPLVSPPVMQRQCPLGRGTWRVIRLSTATARPIAGSLGFPLGEIAFSIAKAYPATVHFRAGKRNSGKPIPLLPVLQYKQVQGLFFGKNFWDHAPPSIC